jgi:hypothetical protein
MLRDGGRFREQRIPVKRGLDREDSAHRHPNRCAAPDILKSIQYYMLMWLGIRIARIASSETLLNGIVASGKM